MSDYSSDIISSSCSSNTPRVDTPISKGNKQHTLRHSIFCHGVGLHTGRNIRLSLHPMEKDTGIYLQRTDIPHSKAFRLSPHNIIQTQLATVASPAEQPDCCVMTIEHLMAALYAMDIDNVLIQISGPEIPILDGCADAFGFLLRCAGSTPHPQPRKHVALTHTIEVKGEHGAFARLIPHKLPTLHVSLGIDFTAPLIGKQRYDAQFSRSSFFKDLSYCRTFINYADVAILQKNNMALGGSLENSLVVHHDQVLNPGGLRTPHEFVRHKALDALGDLYCSGYKICARFEAFKTGHTLNNRLLREVFSSHKNWYFIPDRRRLSSTS